MIVAVCCPGPSLPHRWRGRDGYDRVYAVNRALIAVPDADWLSAGDCAFYSGDLLPPGCRPRAGVLTFGSTADAARAWANLLPVDTWSGSPLIEEHRRRGRPVQWSVQAALCHAGDAGADWIDLYGCDGAAGGTPIDCTGYAGESRGPDRWAREEMDLAMTLALLAERAIPVYRIPPTSHGAHNER